MNGKFWKFAAPLQPLESEIAAPSRRAKKLNAAPQQLFEKCALPEIGKYGKIWKYALVR